MGFSNDGKILAIVQTDKSVALWSIADPASSTYSLDFSPDERWLVGTSGDDLIWGWDLASDATTAHLALSGEVGRSIGDQLTADEWKRYLPGIEPRKVC